MKKSEQLLRGCLSHCRVVEGRSDCKNCGLSKEIIDQALTETKQSGIDEAVEKIDAIFNKPIRANDGVADFDFNMKLHDKLNLLKQDLSTLTKE